MNNIKIAKQLISLAKKLTYDKEIKSIIYIAGVIEDNNKLKTFIQPGYSNVFCHHMTIKFGGIDTLPDFIGEEINFTADKIYKDDKGIAITGFIDNSEIKNLMKSNNQHAHITICTATGVKPVYSNVLISQVAGTKIKLNVKMKVGAFCIFEDGSKGWIY